MPNSLLRQELGILLNVDLTLPQSVLATKPDFLVKDRLCVPVNWGQNPLPRTIFPNLRARLEGPPGG